MPKLSLKDRLLKYVRSIYPNEIAKGELDRIVMLNTKYVPENVGRRMREMVNEGLLEVRYGNKNHAFYKASGFIRTEYFKVENGETFAKHIWK